MSENDFVQQTDEEKRSFQKANAAEREYVQAKREEDQLRAQQKEHQNAAAESRRRRDELQAQAQSKENEAASLEGRAKESAPPDAELLKQANDLRREATADRSEAAQANYAALGEDGKAADLERDIREAEKLREELKNASLEAWEAHRRAAEKKDESEARATILSKRDPFGLFPTDLEIAVAGGQALQANSLFANLEDRIAGDVHGAQLDVPDGACKFHFKQDYIIHVHQNEVKKVEESLAQKIMKEYVTYVGKNEIRVVGGGGRQTFILGDDDQNCNGSVKNFIAGTNIENTLGFKTENCFGMLLEVAAPLKTEVMAGSSLEITTGAVFKLDKGPRYRVGPSEREETPLKETKAAKLVAKGITNICDFVETNIKAEVWKARAKNAAWSVTEAMLITTPEWIVKKVETGLVEIKNLTEKFDKKVSKGKIQHKGEVDIGGVFKVKP